MVIHPVAVPIPVGCVRAGRGHSGQDQHCKIQQFCTVNKCKEKAASPAASVPGRVAAVFGGPAAGVESWGPKHTGVI